ncbi:MAG: PEP-CTERM sorting domain-containing protein [Fimbriimonas sp.]
MNKFVLTSFAAVAVAATASAQTAAISITGGSQSTLPSDYKLGWAFNTTGSLSVSKLGWNNVGTWNSAQVGIFNRNTGALLTSATVQSSSTDILNGFKYATLATPFTLAAGEYTIAGVGRSYIQQASAVTSNISGLTFVGGRYASGSALTNPTSVSNSGLAYFGANFQAQAVPEPGTFVAIGLGVAAFARRRLRKA